MLSKRTMAGYAAGDLANNLLFQMSLLYLLYYYTDVAGISPGVVGIIFLIARIWDGVNDPIMGILVDRTESPHGRGRVFIRYASLPLAAATVLLFSVPSLGRGKVLFAGATYILWGMLYTMVSIPYASMTAEMSRDPQERTKISSVRMLFMLFGVIIVAVATEPVTGAFSRPSRGYTMTALFYALLASLFYFVCFRSTSFLVKNQRARPRTREKGAGSQTLLREQGRGLRKNGPLLILTAAFLIGATAEYIRETSVIYFVTYNMGDSSLMPLFMGVVVLSMILGNLALPAVTARLDKKGAYMAGALIGVAGSAVFHYIPYDRPAVVLATAAFSSFGFTVVSTLGWAMLPDTVEYGEMVNGERNEGIIYSLFSFSQKLATALAGGIVALTLEVTGYIPGAAQQGAAAERGIQLTLTYLPIICLALSMIILNFYNLDRESYGRILRELEERREEKRSCEG